MIRAIIVDDEELARESLKQALAEFERVQVLAECANGFEALKAVKEFNPDLIFLDIQMPGIDGFDVLELLGNEAPQIVFVTAYDEYALRAFEAHALDYLLKPVTAERLAKTLPRLDLDEQGHKNIKNIIAERRKRELPLQRVLIREGTNVIILDPAEITHIQAQDDYICIYSADNSYLKHQTLGSIGDTLDPGLFLKIHRSYLINIKYLIRIETLSKDSRVAILKTGKKLPISRSGYELLRRYL